MFTGLVADRGRVLTIEQGAQGARLSISTTLGAEIAEGDSVAVNGVCLTATGVAGDRFDVEAMNQTLALTSIGGLNAGSAVNLELALRAADRLGGHIVQGHVDGVGRVLAVRSDGFARRVTVELPGGLGRYVVAHGSIAVDGVSLTVAALDDATFTVSLIPETLERTTLGEAVVGSIVNLEVDVVAKYVEKSVAVLAVDGGRR